MSPKQYELIEHTADLGIHVWAKDFKSLFCHSARAMFEIIACKKKRAARRTLTKHYLTINIAANDREELLVTWLSELLSLSDIHKLILTQYTILKLSNKRVSAKVTGEKFTDTAFEKKAEIKAVTYHGLKIERKKPFVHARVIFDL